MNNDTPNKRTLGEGAYLRLVCEGRWEYAERVRASGAVCLLAVTDERKIVLVEQYRPALGAICVELPAGLVGDLDDPAEDWQVAARRELLEETGYDAQRIEALADGPLAAGAMRGSVTLARACGLTKVGPGGGDDTEDIRVHAVPLDSILPWLHQRQLDGCQVDVKIFAGLYFLSRESDAVPPKPS